MNRNSSDQQDIDLPAKLSQPARQALLAAGYRRLDQLTAVTEAEILKLHGMGPKGIRELREALSARDLSFAAKSERTDR